MSDALVALDPTTHTIVNYTAQEGLPDALFPRLGAPLPPAARGAVTPATATRQLTEGEGSVICGPAGMCTFVVHDEGVIWTRLSGIPGWEREQRILVRTLRGVSVDVDRQAALVLERPRQRAVAPANAPAAAFVATRRRRTARPRQGAPAPRARLKGPLLRLLADHAGGEVLRETVLLALYGSVDLSSARAADPTRAALRKVVDDLNRQVAARTGIPVDLIPYGRRSTMGIDPEVAVCDLELLEAALSLAYQRLEDKDLAGATRLAQWSLAACADVDTLVPESIPSARARNAVGRALVLSLLVYRDPPPLTVACALAALRWFPGQADVTDLVTRLADTVGHPTLAARARPVRRQRLDDL